MPEGVGGMRAVERVVVVEGLAEEVDAVELIGEGEGGERG